MKNIARTALLAIGALLLLGAAYWFFSPREKEVAVLTTSLGPAQRLLAVNGRIRPRLQIDVQPQMGGALIALPFDVGDRVVANQIIARIDDAPEIAAIAEAEASAQAQAATLAQAKRDYGRFTALGEFVSKRDLEQRRLSVEEGQRELNRRRAAVVQAQETRDRRVLRAPFAGVILERSVDPGQIVATDSIIYRIANLENPQISVAIDEIYAAEVQMGMEAFISLPLDKTTRKARIVHVEPRVDPSTGARNARLELDDPLSALPSGLTVTVNLLIETRDRAISIPKNAIFVQSGQSYVHHVSESGKVTARAIAYVDWPSQNVIITQGLQAGETILRNADDAKAGDRVRAADTTEAPAARQK